MGNIPNGVQFYDSYADGALNSSFNAGPKPQVLPSGRQMVSLTVDSTQMTHRELVANSGEGINFPEFTYYNVAQADPVWNAFAVFEFDVEKMCPQLTDFAELRSMITYARPFWGTDNAGNFQDCPNLRELGMLFITNLTTKQTHILGGSAQSYANSLEGSTALAEESHVFMPAPKSCMRFRAISLCKVVSSLPGGGVGKYTMIFMNYDLPSSYDRLDMLGGAE